MQKRAWIVAFLLCPSVAAAGDSARLGVEILGGAPANVKTPLDVRQEGNERLRFEASYRTRPWRPPILWAARVNLESRDTGWSVEVMHHKLYLQDPPAEIQSFSISHGFNFLTVQRVWPLSKLRVRAGAGAVIAHPENTIRNRKLDEHDGILRAGYYIAGPAATVGVGHRVPLGRQVALVIEGRGSVAPVSVPVAGGEAHLTSVSFHLLVGLGGSPFRGRDDR